MRNFVRSNPLFSLCGLNCGLCPMYLDNHCPGCGGGAGNQPCKIARCSQQHQGIEYCHSCAGYPCKKYDGITAYDSFITHRNQLRDLGRAKEIGLDSYQSELTEKMDILKYLLGNHNDGRHKGFFCLAVNLLELQDAKSVVELIKTHTGSGDPTPKEKAALAVNLFKEMAEKRNIELRLNRKPGKKA